ncbi:transcriptional regulator, partial [Amycolatopsis sp. NPDC000673]
MLDIALDTTVAGTSRDTPAADEGARIALDLARVHGLGLVGPGGYAAARALLLSVLTAAPEHGPAPTVLVPAADLGRLLGVPASGQALPDTVTVAADLHAALDALDPQQAAPHVPVVLIASPPRDPDRQARLQHLLDNHAQHGLAALLLGQWRAGITAYVTAAGTISATDPGPGEPLRGTRAFTLPDTATRALLDLLHTAHSRDDRTADTTTHDPPDRDSPGSLEITAGTAAPEISLTRQEKTCTAPRPPRADTGPPTPVPPLALTVFGAPALHWRPDPA